MQSFLKSNDRWDGNFPDDFPSLLKKKRSPISLVVIFPGNHFWDDQLVGSTMGLDHAYADSHHNS